MEKENDNKIEEKQESSETEGSKTENKDEVAVELSLEDKLKEAQDKLLRALAETENQRRRSVKEVKEAFEYGGFNFARETLSVLDNLQRAHQSIKNDENLVSLFPNGCRLEVGTPGVGSELRYDYQYKKNIGRKISLTHLESDENSIVRTYKLIDSDKSGIKVETKDAEIFIPYEKIISAKIKVSFD